MNWKWIAFQWWQYQSIRFLKLFRANRSLLGLALGLNLLLLELFDFRHASASFTFLFNVIFIEGLPKQRANLFLFLVAILFLLAIYSKVQNGEYTDTRAIIMVIVLALYIFYAFNICK